MVALSEIDSVLAARKVKRMLRELKSHEEFITTKRYFKLFRSRTPLSGLAEEVEKQVMAQEKKMFPEHD